MISFFYFPKFKYPRINSILLIIVISFFQSVLYAESVLKESENGIRLLESDHTRIVLEYRQNFDKTKDATHNSYWVVYPSGQNIPRITAYTFQVKNSDGTIQEIHSGDTDAPPETILEITSAVNLNIFGFIRDYQIARLNIILDKTLLLAENKRISGRFSYLKIEIPNPFKKDLILPSGIRKKGLGLEKALENIALNYEFADELRGKPVLSSGKESSNYPGLPAENFCKPGSNWMKLSVTRPGIYKVTLTDLLKNNISPTIVDPRTFRIYSQGKEMPMTVIGAQPDRFNPEDMIVFYAEPVKNIYTQTGIYWLTWGGETGLRIPLMNQLSNTTDTTITDIDQYFESVRLKENHLYEDYVNQPKTDHWFWKSISGGQSVEFIIPVANLANFSTDSLTKFKLELYGKSDISEGHHIQVTLNGASVGEGRWTGRTFHEFSTTLPQHLLKEGENQVQVTLLASTIGFDEIYIDSMKLDYPSQIRLGKRTQEIFSEKLLTSTPNHRVYIQTEGINHLSPFVLSVNPSKDITQITPAFDKIRQHFYFDLFTENRYYIGELSSIDTVTMEKIEVTDNLRTMENQADVIYITHPDFIPAINQLSEYRKKQGFSTRIVNIYDIYNQFSYGVFDPHAIRQFLQYSFYYWKSPAPNYVVLVGDANWDYMDYQGTGTKVFVPSYRPPDQEIINTDVGSNEEYYIEVCGQDNFPDMVIGRISVQNLKEAQNVVEKTIAQETASEFGPWRTTSLIAVDNGFESDAYGAARDYLPLWMKPSYLFEQDYRYITHQKFGKASGRKQSPEATAALLEKMNIGSPFMLYIGHGGGGVWSHKRLFVAGGGVRTSDTYRLHNLQRNLFIYTMSCLNGYFDYPNPPWQSISAEEMVKNPDKGAIAMLVPTGKGGTRQHLDLGRGLAQAFFKDHIRTIGDAIYEAKLIYLMNTSDFGLSGMYLILGDPLAQNVLPKKSIALETSPKIFFPDKENHLKISGKTDSELTEGFVTVGIYNQGQSKPIIEKTRIPFKNRRFQLDMVLPISKNSLILRAYAWNEKTRIDAAGGISIPIQLSDIQFALVSSTTNHNNVSLQIKNLLTEPIQSYDLNVIFKQQYQSKQLFHQRKMNTLAPQEVKLIEIPINVPPGIYDEEIQFSGRTDNLRFDRSTILSIIIESPNQSTSIKQEKGKEIRTVGIAASELSISSREIAPGDVLTFTMPVHNYGNKIVENVPCVFQLDQKSHNTTLWIPFITPHSTSKVQLQWIVPTSYLSNKSEKWKKIRFLLRVDNSDYVKQELYIRQSPDLVISEKDIKVTPLKPAEGETIFFDIMVHNWGQLPARSITIAGYDGDPVIGGQEISNIAMSPKESIGLLNPGESKSIRLRWDPPMSSTGQHQMYFIVDPQQSIRTLNPNNLQVIISLRIFTNADLAVKPEDISWTPVQPVAGDTILVSAVIHNLGESDALTAYPWGENQNHAFDVNFYYRKTNGTEVSAGTHYIPILTAGQSTTDQMSIPVNPDMTSIIVKVDTENEVVKVEKFANTISEKTLILKSR